MYKNYNKDSCCNVGSLGLGTSGGRIKGTAQREGIFGFIRRGRRSPSISLALNIAPATMSDSLRYRGLLYEHLLTYY